MKVCWWNIPINCQINLYCQQVWYHICFGIRYHSSVVARWGTFDFFFSLYPNYLQVTGSQKAIFLLIREVLWFHRIFLPIGLLSAAKISDLTYLQTLKCNTHSIWRKNNTYLILISFFYFTVLHCTDHWPRTPEVQFQPYKYSRNRPTSELRMSGIKLGSKRVEFGACILRSSGTSIRRPPPDGE